MRRKIRFSCPTAISPTSPRGRSTSTTTWRRSAARVVLRPADRRHVVVEVLRPLGEVGEIAVGWAQDYARANRDEMMDLVLEAMRRHLPSFEATDAAVNCHHNYVEREFHYGELVIIPGSMGARSYIVRGKGAAESFQSCAHGAGRRMSRNAAQKRFSVQDLEEQTAGVICRKDKGVIDEIPAAYKPIDEVMANQADLVEPLHTLKQVLCVKG